MCLPLIGLVYTNRQKKTEGGIQLSHCIRENWKDHLMADINQGTRKQGQTSFYDINMQSVLRGGCSHFYCWTTGALLREKICERAHDVNVAL